MNGFVAGDHLLVNGVVDGSEEGVNCTGPESNAAKDVNAAMILEDRCVDVTRRTGTCRGLPQECSHKLENSSSSGVPSHSLKPHERQADLVNRIVSDSGAR